MSLSPTSAPGRTAWVDEDNSDSRSAMENAMDALGNAVEETLSDRMSDRMGSDRAVFSLSVDVDGGEESENARVISPTARDTTGPKEAASFAARSIRFACVMAVIGVAVAVLPLCLTAHEGGRQLTANVWELDLGSSSTTTNSTATPFIWLRATSMNPASWTGKQREHLDAPVAAILPFWACAYASFAATFVLSPWLVVRSWHANEATKSGTFTFAAVSGALLSVTLGLLRPWMAAVSPLGPQGELAFAAALVSVVVLAVTFLFVFPSNKRWSELLSPFYQDGLLILVLASVMGEVLMRTSLGAYLAADSTVLRLLHRCLFLPIVKYAWVHVALAFAVRCEVTYNAAMFLLLLLPVTMATATGHVMLLSAGSLSAAVVMQLICSVVALLEYRLCMKGLSHVDWLALLGTTLCFNTQGSRARGASVADVGDVHFEASGPSPERLAALTNLAVCRGPIEGASATMSAFLFVVLPLNPRVPGGERIQPMDALVLWLVSVLFELVLPQLLVAYWDQAVSRKWQGLFGTMIRSMKESFDLSTSLTIGFITISCVACTLFAFVASLCPAPEPDTGEGLRSFSACCMDSTVACGAVVGG